MIKYGGNDDLKKEMVNIQAEIRENILSLGLAGLKNKIVSISQVLYGVKGSQSKKKKNLVVKIKSRILPLKQSLRSRSSKGFGCNIRC